MVGLRLVSASAFAGVRSHRHLPANVAAEISGRQITLADDGAGWAWNTDPDIIPADGQLDLLTALLQQLGTIAGITGDGSPG